jgi:hypothetical protein
VREFSRQCTGSIAHAVLKTEVHMVCPIAGYKIDKNGARVIGGFVMVFTLTALVVPSQTAPWIYAFLAQDYAFRAFSRPRWSVLGRGSALLLKIFGIAPRRVDAGAKRFAARVGLLFSATLVVTSLADQTLATQLVAMVLATCAGLESLFDFCLGCQMWMLWYALRDHLGTVGSERRLER